MKTRVLVLYGGRSAEREVSRVSAASILSALDRDRYEPVLVCISANGRWLQCEVPVAGSPGHGAYSSLLEDGAEIDVDVSGPNAFPKALNVDGVFPGLHRPYGEAGTV